jgi:hypothetical protein
MRNEYGTLFGEVDLGLSGYLSFWFIDNSLAVFLDGYIVPLYKFQRADRWRMSVLLYKATRCAKIRINLTRIP